MIRRILSIVISICLVLSFVPTTASAESVDDTATDHIKIAAVAAGFGHTVLLDTNGNVWTAGDNSMGQLGRSENAGTDTANPTFSQVTVGDGVKIKAIAAGDYYTVMLDENGNVWTAGDNRGGQLGRPENAGTDTANPTFSQVTVGDGVKIKAIAAGVYHTVLLDEKGKVWTAGRNNYGQLGKDENKGTTTANPTFSQVTVSDGVKIEAIAAGGNHTVLLDTSGNVWTAGGNSSGQLGRSENENEETSGANPAFEKVTDGIGEVEIKAIAAGGNHTVLLDASGNVWTAGTNSSGQLGKDENKGTTTANPTFDKVTVGDGVKIKAIAAGGNHTVLLDERGNVWTAGYDYYGQLGRAYGMKYNQPNPTFTQVTVGIGEGTITDMAAGNCNTVLIDKSGNVWIAGSNQFGQQGRDKNVGSFAANPTFAKVWQGETDIIEITCNTPVYGGDDVKLPSITTGYELEICIFLEDTDGDGDFTKDGTWAIDKGELEAYAKEYNMTVEEVVEAFKSEMKINLKTKFSAGYNYSLFALIKRSNGQSFSKDDNGKPTDAIIKINGEDKTDNCTADDSHIRIEPGKYCFSVVVAPTYTISFSANGGTGTMADETGISGEYTLPANGFTAPAGKKFKGWATSAGGTVVTGNTMDVAADTTLYAIWEDISAKEYDITVTDGKATAGGVEVSKVLTDEQGNRYKVTKSDAKDGEVTFTKPKSGVKGKVKVPDTVTIGGITYKVTAIEANAFKNNKNITKVIIGNDVTVVGKNAFSGCTKLKTVKFGAAVTTIGDKAFYKCTSLTSIKIPAKVTKIGKSAFEGCKKLKTITIKSTKLKSVGKRAFKGIHAKAKIKVPKSKLKKYKSLFKNKGQGKNVKVTK